MFIKGGIGSGNFGHSGVPGQVGGSSEGSPLTKYLNTVNAISTSSESSFTKSKKINELIMKVLTDKGMNNDEKSQFYVDITPSLNVIEADIIESINGDIDAIFTSLSKPSEQLAALEYVQKLSTGTHYSDNLLKTKNALHDSIKKVKESIISELPVQHENLSTIAIDPIYQRNGSLKAREMLDAVTANISDDDYEVGQEAVSFYQHKGDWLVNGFLRKGELPTPDREICEKLGLTINRSSDTELTQAIKEKTKLLDSAMTSKLTNPTILTRFVGEGHPIYDAIKKGKDVMGTVYTEKAYSSTSSNYNFTWRSENLKIQINAPRGTKGLAFGSQYDLKFPEEYEFLLPRNASFKVVGFNPTNDTILVDLIDNGITG